MSGDLNALVPRYRAWAKRATAAVEQISDLGKLDRWIVANRNLMAELELQDKAAAERLYQLCRDQDGKIRERIRQGGRLND